MGRTWDEPVYVNWGYNFVNLIKSRNNYLLIKQYRDKGFSFRDNELAALKKQDKVLVPADVEKIIQREEKYNLEKVGKLLAELVVVGQISEVLQGKILSVVAERPTDLGKELGKELGPKMKLIKSVLEQAKI